MMTSNIRKVNNWYKNRERTRFQFSVDWFTHRYVVEFTDRVTKTFVFRLGCHNCNLWSLLYKNLHMAQLGAAVPEWLSSWLAEQEDLGSIPGLVTWIFRDWLSPAYKWRYGWKIAKSTVILKTTNQPHAPVLCSPKWSCLPPPSPQLTNKLFLWFASNPLLCTVYYIYVYYFHHARSIPYVAVSYQTKLHHAE